MDKNLSILLFSLLS